MSKVMYIRNVQINMNEHQKNYNFKVNHNFERQI